MIQQETTPQADSVQWRVVDVELTNSDRIYLAFVKAGMEHGDGGQLAIQVFSVESSAGAGAVDIQMIDGPFTLDNVFPTRMLINFRAGEGVKASTKIRLKTFQLASGDFLKLTSQRFGFEGSVAVTVDTRDGPQTVAQATLTQKNPPLKLVWQEQITR